MQYQGSFLLVKMKILYYFFKHFLIANVVNSVKKMTLKNLQIEKSLIH